jgi:hypothetical protein
VWLRKDQIPVGCSAKRSGRARHGANALWRLCALASGFFLKLQLRPRAAAHRTCRRQQQQQHSAYPVPPSVRRAYTLRIHLDPRGTAASFHAPTLPLLMRHAVLFATSFFNLNTHDLSNVFHTQVRALTCVSMHCAHCCASAMACAGRRHGGCSPDGCAPPSRPLRCAVAQLD